MPAILLTFLVQHYGAAAALCLYGHLCPTAVVHRETQGEGDKHAIPDASHSTDQTGQKLDPVVVPAVQSAVTTHHESNNTRLCCNNAEHAS